METLEIEVFGRVQGVGFRQTVYSYAKENGIKGFVKNKAEGSVYILAIADKNILNKFLVWLQNNPSLSSIEGMNYNWNKILNISKYNSFNVEKEYSFVKDQKQSFTNLVKGIFMSDKIPAHIVIIPDGNRRWAKSRGLQESEGHIKSSQDDNLDCLIDECKRLGIKYLSLWGFSTENWSRGEREKKTLFKIFEALADKFIAEANSRKIRFRHLGRKDRLPKQLIAKLTHLEKITSKYSDMNVQLLLDYGGRDEIIRAVNKIISDKKKSVSESEFEKFLDSAGIPNPDLIIRTSGELRTSGILPFQGVYAELYFAPMHFPDFGPEDLRKAVEEFSKRKRRFGN